MKRATSINEIGIAIIARLEDGQEVDLTQALTEWLYGPHVRRSVLTEPELTGVLDRLDMR